MTNESVLIAESVSKRYRLSRTRPDTFTASISAFLRRRRVPETTHWALSDVSLEVAAGRAVGIIGHNGAGKSTLLRLLCGVGRPTRGRIQRRGRVHALLELGAGFHPELTGLENLVTGGILSGFSEREARARAPQIVAFAELEEFIDQPVRTYSTGMYLRLAFATAMHFDPAVLVVDEVLAVGDARFQQKCLDHVRSFRSSGGTLLLTSHSREQIKSLCDEVFVLEEGRLVLHADPDRALECYTQLLHERTQRRAELVGSVLPVAAAESGLRHGTQEASIAAVRFRDRLGTPVAAIDRSQEISIELDFARTPAVADFALTLGLFAGETKCFEVSIPSARATFGPLPSSGTLVCRLPSVPLLDGSYFVNCGVYPPSWDYVYDHHWQMHSLSILGEGAPTQVSGLVSVEPAWSLTG